MAARDLFGAAQKMAKALSKESLELTIYASTTNSLLLIELRNRCRTILRRTTASTLFMYIQVGS